MRRFIAFSQNITRDKIIISDKGEIHHIKDVLRLKIGDEVTVFDDKGREYLSILERLSAQGVDFKIKYKKNIVSGAKTKITVACAIPKKSKMDDIVDKLTQLGTNRIIPLMTERVIVKLEDSKKIMRLRRWQRIALNSAKQSQSNIVPTIEQVKGIKEVLNKAQGYDLKLIATLTDERRKLKEILEKTKAKNILVFIGPEGDFTPDEIESAIKAGCIQVSLGDLVLRVETAVISIVSFIRLYEDS